MDAKGEKIKFIECPDCESRVGAEVLASRGFTDDESGINFEVYLLRCHVCSLPICAFCEVDGDPVFDENGKFVEMDWMEGELDRVWPTPKKKFFEFPASVKQSLEEADKCFNAKAYLACSAMCRRTLESLCVDLGVTDKSLPGKLQELRSRGVIDGRLAEWSDALIRMGNIGAHANKGHIIRQDASDILDFTIAICEYVYVLTNKYEKFKARQQKLIQPLPKKEADQVPILNKPF